ncbi:MAG: catalase, partial [Bdellovibrionales bacterium]|nr:catalase [Bdellovibrionales bacterium]
MITQRGPGGVLKITLGSFICLSLLSSCSSGSKSDSERNPAALDNQSEPSLDPALESAYGKDEESDFKGVVEVVRKAVEDNAKLRAQQAGDPSISKSEISIQNDLPKKDYATRDVHRKTNGCYSAQLQFTNSIQDDLNLNISNFIRQRSSEGKPEGTNRLPEAISEVGQLGVFAPNKKYDSIVRFSNGHPQYRHDRDTDARGMAVKILPEQTLRGKVSDMSAELLNKATVLDIVTINFPTFFVNDPMKYMKVN